jgi:hypothetical protein
MKKLSLIASILVIGGAFAPLTVLALDVSGDASAGASASDGFQKGGILDCISMYNAINGSIGQQAATGTYVPVNDAAVTINTYLLLRKECIIKDFLNQVKNHAVASEVNNMIVATEGGRGGNSLIVKNAGTEIQDVQKRRALDKLQNNYYDVVEASVRDVVVRAVARGYSNAINRPRNHLGCSGTKTGEFWEDFARGLEPGCDAYSAYLLAQDDFYFSLAQARYECEQQWQWGRGFYPKTSDPRYPCENVVTSAANVQQGYSSALQAGFDLQKAADDVGEMVNSTFAHLATQAITDSRGAAGLVQSIGDVPSFVDRIVETSRKGVVTAVGNSAISTLQGALIAEDAYQKALRAVIAIVARTINELRSAETQCFNLITNEVCAASPQNGTCLEKTTSTTTSARTLKIDTSRYHFAQDLIDKQAVSGLGMTIRAYSETVLTPKLDQSTSTMAQLKKLADRITNPTQDGDPQNAFKDVDKLSTANPPVLKNNQDVVNMQSTERDIASVLTTLLEETAYGDGAKWSDSTNPSVGWCNVSSSNPNKGTLIEAWKVCFKEGSTSCLFPRTSPSTPPTS